MLALVYLAHIAVVIFGAVTLVWLISLIMRDASIIDIQSQRRTGVQRRVRHS